MILRALILTNLVLVLAAGQNTGEEELARVGYSSAIPLGQAVDAFNRRAQRDAVGKNQPLLKADEVVAAIRAWDVRQDPIDRSALQVFQTIARTGTMPKGSYLRYIPGVIAINGFDVDVWWIDLQVELDKYPTDLADVPMYARRIRTVYVSSRPHK